MNPQALLRLMQLTSANLPVGAYAYSQGLEHAVAEKWIFDESSATDWISGVLKHVLCQIDVPIAAHLYKAWQRNDNASATDWNNRLYACRESAELQMEDRHMGNALARLLRDLNLPEAECWIRRRATCFATLFMLAAARWRIPLNEALNGYLWTWTENQVLICVKLIPLGQTQGQKILFTLAEILPNIIETGLTLKDEEIGFAAPGLAIGSALHEAQGTRLFRS